MNNKVSHKSNDLAIELDKFFGKNLNKARIKFLGLFICALCKVQTVCFEKLAIGFENNVKASSSLRRIQRFIADFVFDKDLVAQFIFALLPHKGPYIIAMDRTNWKFGQTNINALVISIVYHGVAFPLMFSLLDKRGNSNYKERKDLVKRYITLFGKGSIKCLVADREFVGGKWIEFLNHEKIHFYLRTRENFFAIQPKTGKAIKVSRLFEGLNADEFKYLRGRYIVNNQPCYISASRVRNKKGEPELQVIISFCKPEKAQEIYKERWQIESAFKALKSSGFNIEDTHLKNIDRIEKLFHLVMIAFTWAYVLGIYLHENIKPIRILKHGRKAKSFVKYGLEYIANVLLNQFSVNHIDITKFLSCT